MFTPRASASTSSGCAYSRSILSRTRRSSLRSRRRCSSAGVLLTCEIVRRTAVAVVAPVRRVLFHYDASVVTMVVPLFMPDAERGNSGELVGLFNTRPSRHFVLANIIDKIVRQRRFYRRHLFPGY